MPRHSLNRRVASLLLPALLSLTAATRAAGTPAESTVDGSVQVVPGLHLLPGRFVAGEQPDGNSLLLEAPQGLILVDTGRHPAHTQAVLALARRLERPVAALLNTHWHLDHCGGNRLVREAFPQAPLYASSAMGRALGGYLAQYRGWLEGEVARLATDSLARRPLEAELRLLADEVALRPDSVVEREGEWRLAGRPLQLFLSSRAVTSADLWIYDPASRVLIAGDLLTLPAPLLDTACPEGWERELDRLAGIDFRWLVPGHGPPLDRAAFELWRAAYSRLLACAASGEPRESCVEGWLADCASLIPAADLQLARSLLEYSLDQLLRGDPARLDRLCGH